jgi:hypothetical protein
MAELKTRGGDQRRQLWVEWTLIEQDGLDSFKLVGNSRTLLIFSQICSSRGKLIVLGRPPTVSEHTPYRPRLLSLTKGIKRVISLLLSSNRHHVLRSPPRPDRYRLAKHQRDEHRLLAHPRPHPWGRCPSHRRLDRDWVPRPCQFAPSFLPCYLLIRLLSGMEAYRIHPLLCRAGWFPAHFSLQAEPEQSGRPSSSSGRTCPPCSFKQS